MIEANGVVRFLLFSTFLLIANAKLKVFELFFVTFLPSFIYSGLAPRVRAAAANGATTMANNNLQNNLQSPEMLFKADDL